jgi:hypothetical protein
VVTTSLERRTIAVPVNEALVESFAYYDSTAEPDDRLAHATCTVRVVLDGYICW